MVQEHGFIIFFFQIMLDEYFISKKRMAQTLDVSLRTLQYNFKRIKLKKGGCMALTNLLLYCYENEISVDQIYRRDQNLDRSSIKGDGKMSHSGMMKWMYHYVLGEVFDSDVRNMAIELRVTEKTLQKALEQDNCAESMLLFEQLMHYCMEHSISMDAILALYTATKSE